MAELVKQRPSSKTKKKSDDVHEINNEPSITSDETAKRKESTTTSAKEVPKSTDVAVAVSGDRVAVDSPANGPVFSDRLQSDGFEPFKGKTVDLTQAHMKQNDVQELNGEAGDHVDEQRIAHPSESVEPKDIPTGNVYSDAFVDSNVLVQPAAISRPEEGEQMLEAAQQHSPVEGVVTEKVDLVKEETWVDDPGELRNDAFFQLVIQYRDVQVARDAQERKTRVVAREVEKISKEQIWKINRSECVFTGECIKCHRAVRASVPHEVAFINEGSLDLLKRSLYELRCLQMDETLRGHVKSHSAKLKVVRYIDDVFNAFPELRVPTSAPISMVPIGSQKPRLRQGISELQRLLQILFFFYRNRALSLKVSAESQLGKFYLYVQKWILAIGAAILRVGSFDDHLFILQHLLLCPDIASWATGLIQFPKDISQWNHLVSDHFVRVVALIVTPRVQSRRCESEDQLSVTVDLSATTTTALKKSIGSENALQSVPERHFQLLETDLLSLFEQLPFAQFYHFIETYKLPVYGVADGTMTNPILELLKVLCTAIDNLGEYKAFAQLTARSALLILKYIGSSLNCPNVDPLVSEESYLLPRIAFEKHLFEFMRVLSRTQQTVLYQFLTQLPYSDLRGASLWKALGILATASCPDWNKQQSQCMPENREDWNALLRTSQPIASILSEAENPRTEFLMQAIAELGAATKDYLFCLEECRFLYSVFSAADCPDHIAKSAALAIGSLCNRCHNCVDDIVMLVDATFETKSYPQSFYAPALFRGLPLDKWSPSEPVIGAIGKWLLCHIESQEFYTARFVLDSLAWQNPDVLPVRKQRLFAASLGQCWMTQHRKGLLISPTTALFTAAYATGGSEKDPQKVVDWIWLRLLTISYFTYAENSFEDEFVDSSDLQDALSDQISIIKADSLDPRDTDPLLVFLSLMLSPFGTTASSWVSDLRRGFLLLKMLLYWNQSVAAAVVVQQLFPRLVFALMPAEKITVLQCPALLEILQALYSNSFSRNHSQMEIAMSWLRGGNVGSGETNDLEMVVASHSHFLPEQLSTQMALFWLHIGMNACSDSGDGPSDAKAKPPAHWLEVPYLRRIVETVICSWFTYRVQQLPAPVVRDSMVSFMPQLLESGENGAFKSLLPNSPNPRGWGDWFSSFFTKIDVSDSSWSVFVMLFLESLADVPQRTQRARVPDNKPPESFKVSQWVEYAVYYSPGSPTKSPIWFLYWQMALNLFFDFSTGLRPFRFVGCSRPFKDTKTLIIAGLEKLIASLKTDENPKMQEALNAFECVLFVISHQLHGSYVPASLPDNLLLRRMLTISPLDDPRSLMYDYVDMDALRGTYSAKSHQEGSDVPSIPLPISPSSSSKNLLENLKPARKTGLEVLSETLSQGPPKCAFESKVFNSLPMLVSRDKKTSVGMRPFVDVIGSLVNVMQGLSNIKVGVVAADAGYIGLLPSLYVHVTTDEIIREKCSMFCSGEAMISVRITRAAFEPNILESVKKNRAEASRICKLYKLNDLFSIQCAQLKDAVSTVVEAVFSQQQSGIPASGVDAYPLLIAMITEVSKALEIDENPGYDPVRLLLKESLSEMVKCWVNCGHSEALEEFLNMILRCVAPHQIAFLISLFVPTAGPSFFVLLQKAIVGFSGVVVSNHPEVRVTALSALLRQFDFSRWFASQPPPDDQLIDSTQDLLVDAFCCAPAFCKYLQDYVRGSLETILSSSSYNHLVHFIVLALRYSLPISTQLCRVCCFSPSMWSVMSRVQWNMLTPIQRAIVIQSLIKGLDEVKEGARSSLFNHICGYLTPIITIIRAVQPSEQDGYRFPRDAAVMLADATMKLFSLLFTCTNISNVPWSESNGGDAANARQFLTSLFSLVGACAQFAEDMDTSSLVLDNAWNVLTDDGKGMLGIHSIESEFPPAHVQNMLLDVVGSVLPWFLWCPQTAALERIQAILAAGMKRRLISQQLNKMILQIVMNVTRADSHAASISLQRNVHDSIALATCLAQSFAHCNDSQVISMYEGTFAESVNSLGLDKLPDAEVMHFCDKVEELFVERVKNRDTIGVGGSSSPISFLLSMILAAGGINTPAVSFCACDAVAVTPNCTVNRLQLIITSFGNVMNDLLPATAATEQQIVSSAVKALLTGISRTSAQMEAIAAKAAGPYAECGVDGNLTNTYESLTLPLLVQCLGCPVNAVKDATALAIRACLSEDARNSAPTNILHALTSLASSATTSGNSQIQVPMSLVVQLAAEAVDAYFVASAAWIPLVDAFAVPTNALADFISQCVTAGEGYLLHLVWLTTTGGDRERFKDILLSWIDAVSVAHSGSRVPSCVLLVSDLLGAIVPLPETSMTDTKQYVPRIQQLQAHLDKMHDDKKNKLMGYLHLSALTSCSPELQLMSSALSQFLQACQYSYEGGDGKITTIIRMEGSDPHGITPSLEKHNRAFTQRATSPEFVTKFGKDAMNSLVEEVIQFLQSPENTIQSWPRFVAILVRHLFPSSLNLAELRNTP